MLTSVWNREDKGFEICTVGNAGSTISGYRGFFGYLGYGHRSNYRLDGEDATIRSARLDVLDFSMRQRIRS